MFTKIMKWVSIMALLLAFVWRPSTSYQVMLEILICVSALLVVTQAWRAGKHFWAAGFVAIAGIVHLWTGARACDRNAKASTEISVVFAIMTLATGSIWAKPIWAERWAWDSRPTLYLIPLLIYPAYLMLRVSA